MKKLSFFIAGTMQGSRRGADQIEQNYRTNIAATIIRVFPNAEIHCPGTIMVKKLSKFEEEIRASHGDLVGKSLVNCQELAPPLQVLTRTFHELVDLSAQSDVCIAFLPDHEASMGTATEMFSAYKNGQTVIAITEMIQNLAVLSCSSMIIPSIDQLEGVLKEMEFNQFDKASEDDKCA